MNSLEFQSVSTFAPNQPVRDRTGISDDRIDVPARKLGHERKPPWIVSSVRRIRPFRARQLPPPLPFSFGDDDDDASVAGDGEGDGEVTANWRGSVPHSLSVRCPSASDLLTNIRQLQYLQQL